MGHDFSLHDREFSQYVQFCMLRQINKLINIILQSGFSATYSGTPNLKENFFVHI
jgi:hypothetical protein